MFLMKCEIKEIAKTIERYLLQWIKYNGGWKNLVELEQEEVPTQQPSTSTTREENKPTTSSGNGQTKRKAETISK